MGAVPVVEREEQETSTRGVTMRRLIVSNVISLDGYASGPGGDVMALPFDATFSDYNLEFHAGRRHLGVRCHDPARVP
jgi:hypothetical protein